MKKAISLTLAVIMLLCFTISSAHAWTIHETPEIVGDVNNDGAVEVDDVTFLQRNLAEIPLPFEFDEKTADADEDAVVTIIDATWIQRWLLGALFDTSIHIGENVYNWRMNKDDADFMDHTFTDELEITRICRDHFFASPIIPLPIEYKIHGVLSDHWCVGDYVRCTFKNGYRDKDGNYYEAELLSIETSTFAPEPDVPLKPVIYLYPEEETEVSVKMELDGYFLRTLPIYDDGWQVTAAPDGTLTSQSGFKYPYLFWEAKMNTEYGMSEGFCVRGSETEAFLRGALAAQGLNEKEIDDFVEFWLSFMKDNPYNVISFKTSEYTEAAKLYISPQPDTVIRVFMTWYGSDTAVDIPEQTLTPAQRSGFTAVEWGGQKVK